MDKKGFSLVEVSIVVIIVGLLIGGIMAGDSLINQAKITKTVSDFSGYQTALRQFQLKYDALPGDMIDATSYFGAADNGDGIGSDCTSLQTDTGKLTCNGDGDFLIDTDNEHLRLWQQLSYGGFIKGGFSGTTLNSSVATWWYGYGSNVPKARFGDSNYTVLNTSSSMQPSILKNQLLIVPNPPGAYSFLGSGVLKSEEAMDLDSKMDDSKPGTGTVQAGVGYGGTITNCVTSTDITTSIYDLSKRGLNCNIYIDLNLTN